MFTGEILRGRWNPAAMAARAGAWGPGAGIREAKRTWQVTLSGAEAAGLCSRTQLSDFPFVPIQPKMPLLMAVPPATGRLAGEARTGCRRADQAAKFLQACSRWPEDGRSKLIESRSIGEQVPSNPWPGRNASRTAMPTNEELYQEYDRLKAAGKLDEAAAVLERLVAPRRQLPVGPFGPGRALRQAQSPRRCDSAWAESVRAGARRARSASRP